MIKKHLLLLLFASVFTQSVSAQQDGYWDKDRATTREIVVGAGNRITVPTEDLPVGTTEIVYRITLLDENQQIANSLVSVLKAIPDPTGISQGSAGAVFLLSKVSGEDECKYAIFTDIAAAAAYTDSGKTDKACVIQSKPLSKDAKRLSVDKSVCFQSDKMWFGFESKNWIMNQKIVLEVVPWVDNKLSRGWTVENRKTIIRLCKSSDLAKKMINSDDFCLCILEKMQKQYRFSEYDKSLAIEKTKAFKDFGNACLNEKPANTTILNNIRADAAQYFRQKKYSEAIDLLLVGIVEKGNAGILDYNELGMYCVFSKQYDKAIKYLKEGEKLDDSELRIKLNLAHAYLLNDDFRAAKEIHKRYRNQNVTATQSWIARTKSDFADLKKAGITSEDFDRILNLFQ